MKFWELKSGRFGSPIRRSLGKICGIQSMPRIDKDRSSSISMRISHDHMFGGHLLKSAALYNNIVFGKYEMVPRPISEPTPRRNDPI